MSVTCQPLTIPRPLNAFRVRVRDKERQQCEEEDMSIFVMTDQPLSLSRPLQTVTRDRYRLLLKTVTDCYIPRLKTVTDRYEVNEKKVSNLRKRIFRATLKKNYF